MQVAYSSAIQVANIFRNPTLIDGKNVHMRIKHLNEEERKLCFESLNYLESLTLEDQQKASQNDTDQKERMSNISKWISEPLEEKTPYTPECYEAPFIKIAKWVHSLFLWFKNTFLGRISSHKLYDLVEVYRYHAEKAKSRIQLIESTLISNIDQKIEASTEKIRQIQRNIEHPMKIREMVFEIETRELQAQVPRLVNACISKCKTASLMQTVEAYEDIVKRVVESHCYEPSSFFEEGTTPPQTIEKKHIEAALHRQNTQINQLLVNLNQEAKNLGKLKQEKEELIIEVSLLKKKYPLATNL